MHIFCPPVLPTFTKLCLFLCVSPQLKKNTIEIFFIILIWCKIVCPVLESAYENECGKVTSFLCSHNFDRKYESLRYMFSGKQYQMLFLFFADHASQYIYLNINKLDALNFIMSIFHASTCFDHTCPSSGGQNFTIQSLVSSHI